MLEPGREGGSDRCLDGMEWEGAGRARAKVCEMEQGVGRRQEMSKADMQGGPPPRAPHVGRLQPLSREPQCHGNECGHSAKGRWGVNQMAQGTWVVRSGQYGPTAGMQPLTSRRPPHCTCRRWEPAPRSPVVRGASALRSASIYETQPEGYLVHHLFSQFQCAKLEFYIKCSHVP